MAERSWWWKHWWEHSYQHPLAVGIILLSNPFVLITSHLAAVLRIRIRIRIHRIHMFLGLQDPVNVPTKSNKQKNLLKKNCFLLASWRSRTKIEGSRSKSGSGSISQRHGSVDPDPDAHQNVMDPEHCWAPQLKRSACWGREAGYTVKGQLCPFLLLTLDVACLFRDRALDGNKLKWYRSPG